MIPIDEGREGEEEEGGREGSKSQPDQVLAINESIETTLTNQVSRTRGLRLRGNNAGSIQYRV